MAIFEYTARDMAGRKLTGKVESSSRSRVIDEILGRKAIPVSVKKVRSISDLLPGGKIKLKREELIIFTRQLLTMLKAGIGILSCLHSLKNQSDNPEMKKLVDLMFKDVSAGKSLSEAMAQHSDVFSDVYISTIRVGEEGGVLDEVLERLVYLLEHELETRAALKQATRYPLMVLAGLGVSFMVAIFFVLPKFSQLYSRFEADLPLPTRILLRFNDAIHDNLITIFIILLLLTGTIVWFLRTEKGKRTWDRYKLAMPIVGPLFVRIAVTRFAKMFATLDKCGLPILRNLEIVAESVGNIIIAKEIMYQRDCIRQGKSIAEPLRESKYFPPLVTEMLTIGEASGSMEEVLNAVADHYDREINYAVKNMTTLIEPLITVVMGGFVLFMAIAVFLPMWKMSSVIRK